MSVPSFSRPLQPSSTPAVSCPRSSPGPSTTKAAAPSVSAPAPSLSIKTTKRKAPKKKTLKDPSAPKRPQTSFLFISAGEERLKVMMAEMGNISVVKVVKEMD